MGTNGEGIEAMDESGIGAKGTCARQVDSDRRVKVSELKQFVLR
jgi:hypothetical protein